MGASAQAPPCAPNPARLETVYAISLNSRLFFSNQSQVDSPLANPQAVTGLLTPSQTNPDVLVFGITIIDYSSGGAQVKNADAVVGNFEIQIFPIQNATGAASGPVVIGVPNGTFFTDFVVDRPTLAGRVVKLARVEIPTSAVFGNLPSVSGDPQLAIGTVLGVHKVAGATVGCGYMSPFSRYLGFSKQAEETVTTVPTPFMIARRPPGGAPAQPEVVEVEPMNVITKMGGSFEQPFIVNPPAIAGIATSPTNNSTNYDFALTFVRYAQNGTAQVFTDPVCASPMNNSTIRRFTAGTPYPTGTRLSVRIQPFQQGLTPLAPQVEGTWNGSDAAILPLVNTLNISKTGFFCVARVSVPICDVQKILGPLPGVDRRIRIGFIEGRHVVKSNSADVVQNGFYNRQNRLVVGSRELSQVSTSVAQPVIFLVDQEPLCL